MSTIATIRRDTHASAPSPTAGFWPRLPAFGRLITRMADALESLAQKHRSRRLLLELSDEQLKDIGISRADAHREADRPFWA